MQRITEILSRFKEFITFLALVIISLSLISLGNTNRIGGFRAILVGGIGMMQSLFSWVPNPQALKNENAALRDLNLQLSNEVTKMRQALIENKYLRDQLNFKKNLEIPNTLAEVVGKTTFETRNFIILNKGLDDGIKQGMPVRNDAGLVGLIFATSNKYSVLEPIFNPTVKITARNQRTRADGIVVWDGSDKLVMKNIPKSFDMKVDDVILTSDISNKFPSEIPIGKVVKVTEEPGELFLKVYVEPFAKINSLEQVFILKKLPDPEINELIMQIDETLKNRKNPNKGK